MSIKEDYSKGVYFIVALVLVGLMLPIVMGCEKKEAVKDRVHRVTGNCELYDKLPIDIQESIEVNFEDKIKLLGVTSKSLSKNQLSVTYYWQLLNELDTYDTVFVHFTDNNNNILFQDDHDFCQRRSFHELKNKFIKEPYIINIPQSAVGKEVYIKIGMVSLQPNIGRLKILSSGGLPIDDLNTRVTAEKLNL